MDGSSVPQASTATTVDIVSTLAAGEQAGFPPTSEVEPAQCTEPVTGIPQTGVALPIPDEFYVAETFTGIFHDESLSSVVVAELPVRLSDELSIDDYLQRLETEQGVIIVDRQPTSIAGYPATLVRAWQAEGGTRVERWLAIAESDDATLLLTAQVPASEPPDALDVLRRVMHCTVWTPGGTQGFVDGPIFTIEPVLPFGEAQQFVGGTVYDGGDGALFLVGPAIRPVQGDRRELALALFASLGPEDGGSLDADPILFAEPESVSISDLDGVRIDGEGSIDGEAFTIFQIVLFGDDDGYWRMVALVPTDRAADLLPAAEAMARSFRVE